MFLSVLDWLILLVLGWSFQADSNTSEEKQAKKVSAHIEKIYGYLVEHKEAKPKEIAEFIGLSPARTRAIISSMDEIEGIGNTSNRRYRLKSLNETE